MRVAKTEAVVLRSFRFGEADRVLHLLTPGEGRVGAIAKGVRRTRARLAGRLEPLSHVEVMVRRGSGELVQVTNADLIRSFDEVRMDPGRLAVALIGVEAVWRLHPQQEANERLFDGLVRFLAVVADEPAGTPATAAASNPLALGFCLKLLGLAGWAPRLDRCAACDGPGPLALFAAAAGGMVCEGCAAGFAVDAATVATLRTLFGEPLGVSVHPAPQTLRLVRRVIIEIVREHAATRIETLTGG
jgi:DNA repair protein RecO (recombination protein O)